MNRYGAKLAVGNVCFRSSLLCRSNLIVSLAFDPRACALTDVAKYRNLRTTPWPASTADPSHTNVGCIDRDAIGNRESRCVSTLSLHQAVDEKKKKKDRAKPTPAHPGNSRFECRHRPHRIIPLSTVFAFSLENATNRFKRSNPPRRKSVGRINHVLFSFSPSRPLRCNRYPFE